MAIPSTKYHWTGAWLPPGHIMSIAGWWPDDVRLSSPTEHRLASTDQAIRAGHDARIGTTAGGGRPPPVESTLTGINRKITARQPAPGSIGPSMILRQVELP
jgi:hypothetical protein